MNQQKRPVSFIHGIQIGGDANVTGYSKRLQGGIRTRDKVTLADDQIHETLWADVSEAVTEKYEKLAKLIGDALLARIPLAGNGLKAAVDLLGDVVVYRNSEHAKKIRKRVREQLPQNSVVVAHSLGSVIAFDILQEDIEDGKYKSADRNTWPFHSLITFGSPLNLKMFFRDNDSHRNKNFSKDFGAWFYWYNLSDRHDPIVSGNVLGISKTPMLEQRYQDHAPHLNVKDGFINTGYHISAHMNYWSHPIVTARVASQITRDN
ncbi:MAG: hypothetical protein JXX14_15185 [Deltaproteobacteria bacterium]|nr:hypothetical protein [Deltaproteobacteria bacterium]